MHSLKGPLHNGGVQVLVSADAESLQLDVRSVTELSP